jgi:hypothetical protein
MLKTVFGTILMLSGTLVLIYQGGGLFTVNGDTEIKVRVASATFKTLSKFVAGVLPFNFRILFYCQIKFYCQIED